MTKKLLIFSLAFLACATFKNHAVEYAMSAWETLDEAFYSWSKVQPLIIQYHLSEGRRDEAERVFNRLQKAVDRWIPLKDRVEELLVSLGKEFNEAMATEMKDLFEEAKKILRETGALTEKEK